MKKGYIFPPEVLRIVNNKKFTNRLSYVKFLQIIIISSTNLRHPGLTKFKCHEMMMSAYFRLRGSITFLKVGLNGTSNRQNQF